MRARAMRFTFEISLSLVCVVSIQILNVRILFRDQSVQMSGYPASIILFKRPRTGFEIIHLYKQLEWNLLKMHPTRQPIVIESDTQKQIHQIHTTRSGLALTETASRCILATYPR
ncbi:Hypothetical_protein [Hexamita inflata]|uniref:Hypothetical_protein n=1 Tax=Hexamita inflata TaxID=28002 RepID=A0AA86UDY4_9EUKA|nr:Hypothetical protein HINF_LOCUS34965 [Hexamita inflata]CAI9947322.1 Hypothetical protein HINF_LOCUS34967 [Hexamita inflata]CAI9947327.1 Hypothetical protein HINF_LOCUS34972 [Hexamita inflata]